MVAVDLLASSTAIAAVTPLDIAAFLITHAKQAVRDRARDPDATEFRNVGVYRPDPDPKSAYVVCGEANAKNGFGGYNGYQTFVWLPIAPNGRTDINHGTAFIGSEVDTATLKLCRNRSN